MERQRIRITNMILKKQNKVGLTLPYFKTHYKATVIKTVQYGLEDTQIYSWNKIERPEIDSHKYSALTYDKGASQFNAEKNSFSINDAGIQMNLDTELSPYKTINSKLIIDIAVKCKTIKFLEDAVGENAGNAEFGNELLDTISKAHCEINIAQLGFVETKKNISQVKHCLKNKEKNKEKNHKLGGKNVQNTYLIKFEYHIYIHTQTIPKSHQ